MVRGSDDHSEGLYLIVGKDPLGDSKVREIYFLSGAFAFPGRGWTDLVGVTDSWREELRLLERDGVCKLWFFDGPYQVKITQDGGQYEFEFCKLYEDGISLERALRLPAEKSIENIRRSLGAYQN
jgi:hypothetical protein